MSYSVIDGLVLQYSAVTAVSNQRTNKWLSCCYK